MKPSPSIYTKNRVLAPVLLGVAILFGIVIVRPMYATYVEQKVTLTQLEADQSTKDAEVKNLEELRDGVGVTPEVQAKANQLNRPFVASDIIEEVILNAFTEASGGIPKIQVSSISVDPGSTLPSGLSMGSVNVTFSATTLEDLIEYLTYLTQKDRKFALTFNSISLPIDTEMQITSGAYSLAVTFGMYYYE